MNIVMEESQNPVTDLEVQYFESEWGCDLPEDYKIFLKNHNGVSLDNVVLKVGEDNLIGIQSFIPLNEMLTEWRSFEVAPPMSMLPIASCEGGDYIYMDVLSGGKVYYCDHESWDDYTFVSETFGSFLESMKLDEGPLIELDPKDIVRVWESPNSKELFDKYRIK